MERGFQCKERDKPAKNPLNLPSVSLTGEKNENIGQTELGFALIMPEIGNKKWYMRLHVAKLQFSSILAVKHAS